MSDNINTILEVSKALTSFPYFIINKEIDTGYNLYVEEIRKIQELYIYYKKGVDFQTEGSGGDYVPSHIKYKKASRLINKEARFMFSQTPDVHVRAKEIDETSTKQAQQYQTVVDKVLKDSHFSRLLLQGAKDCFIAKRIACAVDYSEQDGILIHFYNSLQFYYETDYNNTDRLTKFISFEKVNKTKSLTESLYLVNRYEDVNGKIMFSSVLYNGTGNEKETLIPETKLQIDYIPAVVITNDGLLNDRLGVSDFEELIESEAGYSKLSNEDIDAERKGMNPIRYTVDMSSNSTKNLPSGAGAYWDLQHNSNINDPSPQVGTLAPAMNHTEAVRTTLERLNENMYETLDIPDVSKEGLLSGITSFKALKALYYPLTVRCNEKLKTWKPKLERLIEIVIDFVILNAEQTKSMYVLNELNPIQYNVIVSENYALLDDETEEKETDLNEISAMARSRKSYLKKWRSEELNTEEKIEEELMQIAIEQNMMDTLSMNTSVQTELNKQGTEAQVNSNLEQIKTEQTLNQNK